MEYLRLLFWLKWKLMFRGYRRNPSSALGVVLSILFFLPFAVAIAVGCWMGFRELRPPWNEHLLRGLLLGVYVFWLSGPLLGYALSDSYDITRLFHYPLTLRQIFIGAIAGSVMDFPVLLLLPTLAAILAGFTSSILAFLPILIALALFLFHTLALSQAILLASAGILRSRKFRDALIVLIPVFWMGYYILSRLLSRQVSRLDWIAFLKSPAWEALNFLPPGFAARAVAAAGRGDYLLSLLCLFGLFLFCTATVYLAGWLVQMAYAGETISLRGRKRRSGVQDSAVVSGQWSVVSDGGDDGAGSPNPQSRVPPGRRNPAREAPGDEQASSLSPASSRSHAPTLLRSYVHPRSGYPTLPRSTILPPVVEAVVDKEFKYMVRDPYFKVALMNLVYMVFVAGFAFFGGRGESFGTLRPVMLWSVTGFMLLTEMNLVFNVFGTEGGAATVLFLFPSSRRQILLGKNLALFAALSAVNLVFLLLVAAAAGALPLFGPLFCWMELALLVFIAAGNFTSIWFPFRVVMRGWRVRQQSASRGCGYSFLYLGASSVAFALLLPILAALLVPTFWVSPAWYLLGIPLALVYAAGLYWLSLRLAEPLLLQQEVTIIQRVSDED
jgi:ABC-2 type transport system permease protein